MAGLIQEQTKQAINGVPGSDATADSRHAVPQPRLRQQPDRTDGPRDALFVRAVAQKDLSRPDDGFARLRSADRCSAAQPHLRRSGPHRAGTELSRHLRLHHGLRRDEETTMTSSNIRRPQGGPACGSADRCCRRARRLQHTDDEMTTASSPTTIACAIRSRSGSRAHDRTSSSAPPRRPSAAQRAHVWPSRSMAAGRHRRHHHRHAGRHAERAGRRRCVARNAGVACRRRRSAARRRRAPVSPADPRQFAAIRLNYPKITAKPGRAACGPRSRPVDRHERYSTTSPIGISAAPTSAISPRWSTIQRTSCSRAPKRRPIRRAHAAFDKYRKGTSTSTIYPEADKGKISDIGK